MDLPEDQPDITSEFLANALGHEFEILNYKVTSGSNPGDNFMSVLYCVDLDCKNKKEEIVKKNLILKCYPAHPSRQEFLNRSNMFFKELEIYRLWIPELRRFQTEVVCLKEAIKLPFAPLVYGKCIDFSSSKENEYTGKTIDSLENVIIMEDLRKSGFKMTNSSVSMDIDHIQLVFHELAKIHSFSWSFKSQLQTDLLKKFPCLIKEFKPKGKSLWIQMVEKGVQQAISILESIKGKEHELTKAVMRFQNIVEQIYDVFTGVKSEDTLDSILRIRNNGAFGKDNNSELWRVICHGDCWSNNMLFRYDERTEKPIEVALIDLQIVRESNPILDLVQVIYSCTDFRLRKDHLEELTKLYVDTFNNFCKTLKTETLPGFDLESFKYKFHSFKLIGFWLALLDFPIMLKEEENSLSMNMQQLDRNKKNSEMFLDICRTSGTNTIYSQRLIGLVQELYEEGVI